MASEWICWLEELTQADAASVGRKCANLGELTRAGFRVPRGFALGLDAYEEFLRASGAGHEVAQCFAGFDADPDDPKQLARFMEASAIARALVEKREMPQSIALAVTESYDRLSRAEGVCDLRVATRSAGPASHPGQYESYLNVSGQADVIQNVKKVWSSTFNTRSLIARARKELPLESDPIGVAVITMVEADASGVMFTAEPTTANANRMIVEGNTGLGETVVSGAVIPDNWIVDPTGPMIVERKIADRAQGSGDSGGCLTDEEVLEIARVGKLIEGHFHKPQDIEWAIDRDAPEGPLFILQTRPETFRIDFRF